MKEIKFRWWGADGSYHSHTWEVPNEAEQMVGLDRDGREVYENDTVLDDFGNETLIKLTPSLIGLKIGFMRKKCYHISDDAPSNRKEVWK